MVAVCFFLCVYCVMVVKIPLPYRYIYVANIFNHSVNVLEKKKDNTLTPVKVEILRHANLLCFFAMLFKSKLIYDYFLIGFYNDIF